MSALLVVSGATALAYEVLWARDWALLYGSTAIGTAVVLAAYFTGLAAGAALGGALSRRRTPLVVYAALEGGVALALLAYVGVRPLLPPAAAWFARNVPAGALPAARTALAFAVLAVPSTLLGATLPVVVGVVTGSGAVGRLYAANTIGGAAGALAVALVAVRALGVRGTFLVAVALDALVAATALALGWQAAAPPPGSTTGVAGHPRVALGVAGVTGFVGLAGEVLWMRGLGSVLSNSVYSVAFVLATVLVGLALGARLGAVAAAREPAPRLVLAASFLGIACVGSLLCVRALPALLTVGARALDVAGPGTGLLLEVVLAALVVLVPALALGTVFPLCVVLHGDAPRRATGRVLAVNTAGGIAGALAAAFVLLPRLGVGGGLLALAALAVAAATLAGRPRPLTVVAALATVVAALALPVVRLSRFEGERLLFYRDGPAATVTVSADAAGQKRLRVNGQYSLGGAGGLFLERREAHLPLLLHPAPGRLLALGVGTGDTIGATLAHPGLVVDGVELVPEVLQAAAFFTTENGGVLANPRAHLHADDARTHLLATTDTWDVILSDLFLPWTAGTAALYAEEMYRLGLAHLRPGGLYCQWLPLHQLAVPDLEAIVATFVHVFPEAQLWVAYHRTTTPLAALIGAGAPLRADADALRARLADAGLAGALAGVGLDDPGDLATLYVTDAAHLRAATADVETITDDRPRIEFTAPAAYFHQRRLARAALAWTMARLDPRPGPVRGAEAPFTLRATLLAAGLALLDGDRPQELAGYLDALARAPGMRAVRAALVAIARERRAAGDDVTAARIAGELVRLAPGTPEAAALAR